jgi:hypothetical protein
MAVVPTTSLEGICDISIAPWDSSIRTAASPSVIVFTLATGWYYLCGLFQKGGQNALLALVPFFFVTCLAGIQTFIIMKQPQCPPFLPWGLVMAWVIGILSGAIGYFGGQSAIATEAAKAAADAAAAVATGGGSSGGGGTILSTKNCKAGTKKWAVDGLCYPDSTIFPTGGTTPDAFTNYVRGGAEHFSNVETGAITAFTTPPTLSAPSGMMQAANTTGTPTAMKTPAVDDDTYLVDIYKNGKLVTQSIGESVIG